MGGILVALDATGAAAVAESLGTNLNAAGLFEQIVPFIPWVAGMVGFAFVYNRILKRGVKKASNGKAGI